MIKNIAIAIDLLCISLFANSFGLELAKSDLLTSFKDNGVTKIAYPTYENLNLTRSENVAEAVAKLKEVTKELGSLLSDELKDMPECDVKRSVQEGISTCEELKKYHESLERNILEGGIKIKFNGSLPSTDEKDANTSLSYLADYLEAIYRITCDILSYEEGTDVSNRIFFSEQSLDTYEFINDLYTHNRDDFYENAYIMEGCQYTPGVALYGGTKTGKMFLANCILDVLPEREFLQYEEYEYEERTPTDVVISKTDKPESFQKTGTEYAIFYIEDGIIEEEKNLKTTLGYVQNWIKMYEMTRSILYNMLIDYIEGYPINFGSVGQSK